MSVRRTICVPTGTIRFRSAVERSPGTEDPHLRRRADLRIFFSNWQKPNRISKALGNATGPLLELFPSPLKSMILVPELSCWKSIELHVVFGVGRGHYDRFWVRCLKKHSLECSQSWRV